MPTIEINPIVISVLFLIPLVFAFLIHKSVVNKMKRHFLSLENENLRIHATVLDYEKEIVELNNALAEKNHHAGIVRMDEKQKTKVI